ncbi:hypothetical protein AYI70_g3317, partial [Smittium culicis]
MMVAIGGRSWMRQGSVGGSSNGM